MPNIPKAPSIFKLALLLGLILPATGLAQISEDTLVRRMIQEGRFDDALSSLDASLRQAPRDPQLHLLRGATLSMSNRKGEALKVFAKMVDEQLDVATAYNNIAVILASRGEFQSARVALDCALKANPNYLTAQKNMAEVYANLANQSYRQAMHLDRSDPNLPTKLAHFTQMLGDSASQPARPDVPEDGRYYDQPCTPEPLQVARQPLLSAPVVSINPSPVVPPLSPLVTAPPSGPAAVPAPASPGPKTSWNQDGLPEPSPTRQPTVPLPGHSNTAPPVQSPQAPLPSRIHASNAVKPVAAVAAVGAAPVVSAAVPAPAKPGIKFNLPSSLPRSTMAAPLPPQPVAAPVLAPAPAPVVQLALLTKPPAATPQSAARAAAPAPVIVGLKWSRPSSLPIAAAPQPLPRTSETASAEAEKSKVLNFSQPKRTTATH
jgi:colicin import membrane protein